MSRTLNDEAAGWAGGVIGHGGDMNKVFLTAAAILSGSAAHAATQVASLDITGETDCAALTCSIDITYTGALLVPVDFNSDHLWTLTYAVEIEQDDGSDYENIGFIDIGLTSVSDFVTELLSDFDLTPESFVALLESVSSSGPTVSGDTVTGEINLTGIDEFDIEGVICGYLGGFDDADCDVPDGESTITIALGLSKKDGFEPAVVALPASGILLFGALGGLGLTARRRRR